MPYNTPGGAFDVTVTMVYIKIMHCKFPLRSNGKDHVQCDIKKIEHWRWYSLMYSTSWLPSYTNNCYQHQWVLNLMRFIIMKDKICIEIKHTNLVVVQRTESFEEQYRHQVNNLRITSFPYHTPRKRRSTRLEKPHYSYTLLAILATACCCLVVVVCS